MEPTGQHTRASLLSALHEAEEVIILYNTLEQSRTFINRFTGNLTEVIRAYFDSVVSLNILYGNFTYILQVSFEKNNRSFGIRSFVDTKKDLVDFFCLIRDLITNQYPLRIALCITSPEIKYLAEQYLTSDHNTKAGQFLLKNSVLGIDSVYKDLWHSPSGHQLLYRIIEIKHQEETP